jgi:cysteine synthase A
MKAMGAEVEVVEKSDPHGGYLLSRLARVRQVCSFSSEYVWTNQYGNWANPRAHFLTTGPEIYDQAGAVPAVFIAVSTGGTLNGIARYFRQASPATKIIAVDARGSVIFGNSPGKRKLTGIGSGRPSDFLSPSDYDQVFVVDDKDAFSFCREVYRRTGKMLGGSSGASLAASARFFQMHPEVPAAVCVCPDRGENYASTIYSDEWMNEWGFETDGFGEYEITIESMPNYIPGENLSSRRQHSISEERK